MKNRKNQKCDESFTGQVKTLKNLAAYQRGAIVSRQIVTGKTGNVTVFAFDKGQGLSEHTAPFDALVCLLDGEAEVFIDGKPHRIRSGEMILMPAHHPHALKAIVRFKMMLVLIKS